MTLTALDLVLLRGLRGTRERALGVYDKAKKNKKAKKNSNRNVRRRRGERQRERDGDYDNAEATAVQLWRAAVSTEGDEA